MNPATIRSRPTFVPFRPLSPVLDDATSALPGSGFDPKVRAASTRSPVISQRELSRDFWNMVQRLPAGRANHLITDVTVQQTAEAGVHPGNRAFLESFRDHLRRSDLLDLHQRIDQHPKVREMPRLQRQKLLSELDRLWLQPRTEGVLESELPIDRQVEPAAPDRDFFFRDARHGKPANGFHPVMLELRPAVSAPSSS